MPAKTGVQHTGGHSPINYAPVELTLVQTTLAIENLVLSTVGDVHCAKMVHNRPMLCIELERESPNVAPAMDKNWAVMQQTVPELFGRLTSSRQRQRRPRSTIKGQGVKTIGCVSVTGRNTRLLLQRTISSPITYHVVHMMVKVN